MASDSDEYADEYVCASRARAEFGLKDCHLSRLVCKRKRNRRYPNGPLMRLYRLSEVIALRKAIDAELEAAPSAEAVKRKRARVAEAAKLAAKESVAALPRTATATATTTGATTTTTITQTTTAAVAAAVGP